jgi:hypothetical protein
MNTVTVQIPVSVLLGDKTVTSALAGVSGSLPINTPPAPATPVASPVASDADQPPAATPSPSRPRKLLSDIGRKYWDQVPKSRIGY